MKNILFTLLISCFYFFPAKAQDNSISKEDKKANISLLVNDGEKPDVYIDGKKYDASIVDLLDFDKISSIDILKDDAAMKKYNAPNGVIVITSKNAYEEHLIDSGALKNSKFKLNSKNIGDNQEPLIILDGKVVEKSKMNNLDPNDIESIEVIKGEEAIKKHNAPNGVIKIFSKKN